MADIRIGTSGWTYRHWRGAYYPEGLRQADELAHLAGDLHTVEINGSFYSLQRPDSYRKWRDGTPEGFAFAVKGSRYITHLRKLHDVEQPLATLLASGLLTLGSKLGPMLWQLPGNFGFDAERLEAFLRMLPATCGQAADLAEHCDRSKFDRWGTAPVTATDDPDRPIRHALEVRHPGFDTPEFDELCRRYAVAIVLADSAGTWPWIDRPTTDLGYFRLHGSRELYASGYTDEELDAWAERVRGWCEVEGMGTIWIYFDNDGSAHAPHDARRLAERLGVANGGDAEHTDGGRPSTAPKYTKTRG